MARTPTTTNEKTPRAPKSRDLFIVKTSAITNDGPITAGEIAEAGAKILKKYPLLFKPLDLTYKA